MAKRRGTALKDPPPQHRQENATPQGPATLNRERRLAETDRLFSTDHVVYISNSPPDQKDAPTRHVPIHVLIRFPSQVFAETLQPSRSHAQQLATLAKQVGEFVFEQIPP